MSRISRCIRPCLTRLWIPVLFYLVVALFEDVQPAAVPMGDSYSHVEKSGKNEIQGHDFTFFYFNIVQTREEFQVLIDQRAQ